MHRWGLPCSQGCRSELQHKRRYRCRHATPAGYVKRFEPEPLHCHKAVLGSASPGYWRRRFLAWLPGRVADMADADTGVLGCCCMQFATAARPPAYPAQCKFRSTVCSLLLQAVLSTSASTSQLRMVLAASSAQQHRSLQANASGILSWRSTARQRSCRPAWQCCSTPIRGSCLPKQI
jgi:hypothetical protein